MPALTRLATPASLIDSATQSFSDLLRVAAKGGLSPTTLENGPKVAKRQKPESQLATPAQLPDLSISVPTVPEKQLPSLLLPDGISTHGVIDPKSSSTEPGTPLPPLTVGNVFPETLQLPLPTGIPSVVAPVHISLGSKVEHWLQDVGLSGVASPILATTPLAVLHDVANAFTHVAADNVPKDLSQAAPSNLGKGEPAPRLAQRSPIPPVANLSSAAPDSDMPLIAPNPPTAGPQQLVPTIQPTEWLALTNQIAKIPLVAAKSPTIAATSVKETIKEPANAAGGVKSQLLSSAQPATPLQQSSPQSQEGASAQDQGASLLQTNPAGHVTAAVDHSALAEIALPVPSAVALPSQAAPGVKTADVATPAPAPPEALPLINTARLIQTMGQSEMRVGLRSSDLGNISISTLSTRDVISAQISLDHSELASTLAAHLPEMQARLDGKHPFEVRIDLQGQAAGQGQGSSAGMANNSADGSREQRHTRGNASPDHGSESGGVRPLSFPASLSTGELGLEDRLDITA